MLLILRKRAIKIVVVKSTICIVVGIIALLLINSQILTQIGVPVEVVSIGLPVAALIAILCAGSMLVRAFTGGYQRGISKYLKKNESVTMEQIEADFLSSEFIDKHIWVGKKWTIYLEGAASRIIDNKNIVWAYCKKRTEVRKGIRTVYRSIILNDRAQNTTMIDISSEKAGTQVLDNYRKRQQHIVLGYSHEILNFYIDDFDKFLKHCSMKSNIETDEVIQYKEHIVNNSDETIESSIVSK